jgi:transcription termination factor Rho
VLDRSLAEAHIFPAINLRLSGTRKEERLYNPGDVPGIAGLRRLLSNQRPREAMETLLGLLGRYPSNAELLRSLSAPRA